jgi:hypothetical protein
LKRPDFLGDEQIGVFKQFEVRHHAKAGHIETGFQIGSGLAVFWAQGIQKFLARRVGESFEDVVHGSLWVTYFT